MRKLFVLISVCVCFLASKAQVDYNQYFSSERLRLDLVFVGDASNQSVYLKSLHRENVWAGSRTNLIDTFHYGEYYIKAFDKSGTLLFSTGFSSLFQEWRTTDEAKNVRKAFSNSVWMPFPKEEIELKIYARNAKAGEYEELFSTTIDPDDPMISPVHNMYQAELMENNGPIESKVDLVFVAEGYSREEMDKFRGDAARFTEYLFDYEPFGSHRKDFNIWILPCPSIDSGVDVPQSGIWKNSVLNSTFNTFYVDRYLTVLDYQPLVDVLANVAFDAVYAIANTDKYGGGGIYHYYGLSMSDHRDAKAVFVHEFGHSFAGLGDEYYNSETAYNEMYPLDVEPWEPNITTKVNFSSKWEDMMGIDSVGLYEGAGYSAKGVYRPAEECRMFNNTAPGFCPVCQRAISRMIDFYTK